MGTFGKFLIGVVLVITAQLTIGITMFNESFVFANPGIVDPAASNLPQWTAVAERHSQELGSAISPFGDVFTIWNLVGILLFSFPALAIAFSGGMRKLQTGILFVLSLLLMVDLHNLMEFNGNNSANGGYDGLGEMLCYGLHFIAGACCLLIVGIICLRKFFIALMDRI